MNTLDLTPLYRNSIGFDRLASLLNNAYTSDSASSTGYPPYNIEVLEEDRYAITLAIAGFDQSDVSLSTEKGILTVRGEKTKSEQSNYLHQGIANRTFERKFNLADHVEVTQADLNNGLLTISLKREIPEAMKPKTVAINQGHNGSVQGTRDNLQNQAA